MWPVGQNWVDDPRDDFPLSYYPMFSKYRPPDVKLSHIVGLDAQGRRRTIHYKYAGPGGMNQIRKQIRKAVAHGRADSLCHSIAARLARTSKRRYADLTTVQIVTGNYLIDDFAHGKSDPIWLRVDAECPIRRAGS